MKIFAEKKNILSIEERNLLSVAYKNVVGSRRSSWRIITGINTKQPSDVAQEYTDLIVKELEGICKEVLVSIGL